MRNRWIGFRVVVMIAALEVVWPTSAQAFRGRITGIVTDVAGANVTLTSVGFACLPMLGSVHEEEL